MALELSDYKSDTTLARCVICIIIIIGVYILCIYFLLLCYHGNHLLWLGVHFAYTLIKNSIVVYIIYSMAGYTNCWCSKFYVDVPLGPKASGYIHINLLHNGGMSGIYAS